MLLQTLSTHGKGGVGANARGVKQHGEPSRSSTADHTVALFEARNRLTFDKLVTTTSAPVSVDFGNDHVVAGATTVGRLRCIETT